MACHLNRKIWAFVAACLLVLLVASPAKALPIVTHLIGADAVHQIFPDIDGVDNATGQVQRVAVLDSGIQVDHPGFDGRVVSGINLAANFPYGSSRPENYTDLNGHGTFVSGVIGSSLTGLNGIAPKVELVAVRVIASNGQGDFSELANGLEWVIDHAGALNITAVNISLGSSSTYINEQSVPDWYTLNRLRNAFDELADRNIVSVVASGNSASHDGLSIPAIFDNTVSVGASTKTDAMWSSTNRSQALDILAPGVETHSLWRNSGEAIGSGTSYAAPVITASAVLVREFIQMYDHSLAGSYDNFQERFVDLLQSTGEDIYDPASRLTYQRVNLQAAFATLANQLGVGTPVPEPASLLLFSVGVILMRRNPRRNPLNGDRPYALFHDDTYRRGAVK